IVNLVGAYDLGKIVKSSELREAADANIRNAGEQRVGETGIDLIGEIQVARKNLQNVMGETTTQFVREGGVRSPCPMCCQSLCSRMNARAELRQEFVEV